MILTRITFEVYADRDGTIDPDRLTAMMEQADHVQGGLTAPLEFIDPIRSDDPQPWGLRIVIEEDVPE